MVSLQTAQTALMRAAGARGIFGTARAAGAGVIGRELLGRLLHAEVARGKFLRHAPANGVGGRVVVIWWYTLSCTAIHARHTLPCAHCHPSPAMCLWQTSHFGALRRSMVNPINALLPNAGLVATTSPPMAENTAADVSRQSEQTACCRAMGLRSARLHTRHTRHTLGTPVRHPLSIVRSHMFVCV